MCETRCCYAVALSISSTKQDAGPLRSWKRLIDFEGFLDRRYSVLAVGAFVAMLGQFVPYYYISEHLCIVCHLTEDSNIIQART
jgi:MCP family monocarboxylic acid transporter-like MFS transporter 10